MSSTQPGRLTLLRVKRARTHSALDALHVHVPAKRPRKNSFEAQPIRFRRLPALTDIDTLGPSRVIDIDPALLHSKDDDDSSTGYDTLLYNGKPMSRELLQNDGYMFDFFVDGNNPTLEHLLHDCDDQNIAWLYANNLPIFDNDSSDDNLLSDSDDRSVDYPSTPELSEQASEDAWTGRRTRFSQDCQWTHDDDDDDDDNDDDHTSEQEINFDQWGHYDRDCESEQEGDNYDYEE